MSWHNINLGMNIILFNFIMMENGLLLVSDGVYEDCLEQVIQTKLKPGTTKE